MKYRVMMSVEIEAPGDRQAHDQAVKMFSLLKNPMVKMAIVGEGITLAGEGRPVVYQPQRADH